MAVKGDVWHAKVFRHTSQLARRRECLRCLQGFRSWGPGNRLCKGCRERNAEEGQWECTGGSEKSILMRAEFMLRDVSILV